MIFDSMSVSVNDFSYFDHLLFFISAVFQLTEVGDDNACGRYGHHEGSEAATVAPAIRPINGICLIE